MLKTIKLFADKEYASALEKATKDFVNRIDNKDTQKLLVEIESIKKLLCQK